MKKLIALILAAVMTLTAPAVFAAEEGEIIYASYKATRQIGRYQADGSILFLMQEDAHANANALKELIAGNEKKTIVLPKEKVEVDQTLIIGSNTTIIATGATVYQTALDKNGAGKALLVHEKNQDKYEAYTSLTNVKLIGGKWLTDKVEKKQPNENTSIRFINASNITLDGLTVNTSYIGHAAEFTACRDVTVKNCKLLAIDSPSKDTKKQNEEAVQFDISTPTTSPYAKNYFGADYVKGQTCKNITVTNCEIRGGRGLSANKCDVDANGKKSSMWYGKHHDNIKIDKCTITGATSEAVALHNALNVSVTNCKINSKDKRYEKTYSIGINIASFGKHGSKTKSKITVKNNTVNAGRQAVYIGSYNDSKKFASAAIENNKLTTKFKHTKYQLKHKKHYDFCAIYVNRVKTVSIKKNKTYTKSGKKNAICTEKCTKVTKKGNKAYKK